MLSHNLFFEIIFTGSLWNITNMQNPPFSFAIQFSSYAIAITLIVKHIEIKIN